MDLMNGVPSVFLTHRAFHLECDEAIHLHGIFHGQLSHQGDKETVHKHTCFYTGV